MLVALSPSGGITKQFQAFEHKVGKRGKWVFGFCDIRIAALAASSQRRLSSRIPRISKTDCEELCHHPYMGNKDARRREVKKPKKKTPKLAPPRRDAPQIVSDVMKRTPNS
jgi:hypothetical protein